ncbi:MAG: hypothetical protein DMG15_19430 [Acidobacteria bacterium]|nr:MAG: hypothetical protein DMG16_05025 [Acidobacteriota bacterium]PYS10945.1 MAG: hypothetical protein DMG15_19430 [Acidobacteriota bacterium]
MQPSSNRRLLFLLAAILLISAIWTGANRSAGTVAAQGNGKAAGRTPIVLNTKPVRVVADAAPVLSGIAIDTQRDEVFMTNDKESAEPSIMVYPTQFQPTDRVMEPKRRLAGPKTNLALPCGVAVSPEFQEMFAVSGDGQDINIFPMVADGNSAPSRVIHVPHASGGVSFDIKNDEIYITTEHANRISVYSRKAQGDDDPLRIIQGPNTSLADPHGIYVDADRNEILVTNHGNWRKTRTGEAFALHGDSKFAFMRGSFSHPGIVEPLGPSSGKFMSPSIMVFSRTANGDVGPLRTIQGSRTRLNIGVGISRDPETGEIIVANSGDNSILFFAANANGDVAPLRVLAGPATNLKGATGVAIDTKHNELWVTSWENHMAAVFPRNAEGNVPPLRVIHSAPKTAPPATMGRLGAVAFDSKRQEILAPN